MLNTETISVTPKEGRSTAPDFTTGSFDTTVAGATLVASSVVLSDNAIDQYGASVRASIDAAGLITCAVTAPAGAGPVGVLLAYETP